ncbi:metallophosphoesterase [Pedobacter sp. BS3]|uniref:metallophosphoesterase n=1 Tax=Pedobacter sp. BS3 TaxID=2567937 RepID=UPI0011EE2C61|nr:metallophosphoesterase [Pedobacter sp. BS3]TZF81464.1 metallophosphoesterase [Pedobacter sp. BS3]
MADEQNGRFDLFLIGDTGSVATGKPDAVLEMLHSHIQPNHLSAIIFLGDNIYPRGLPPKGHLLRKAAEAILKAHHEALKDYPGKVLFIPGNHDWNKGRKDGYDYILRQEKYLEKLFDGKNIFLPSKGCPGPTEVSINDKLSIVLINTQWWMQKGVRPIGQRYGCRAASEDDFFTILEQILEKNRNKRVVIAGHHPVYSYAIHGGRFKLKHHLFPLTIYDKDAYIPLPIIGSLLPLYRKFIGAEEDMAHPRYRNLRKQMKAIFSRYSNLIYASGHEHNLQYICKNNNHFIISGAGSKLKYVIQEGKYLEFGRKAKGFFKLVFQPDGSVYLSSWVVNHIRKEGELAYEKQIL